VLGRGLSRWRAHPRCSWRTIESTGLVGASFNDWSFVRSIKKTFFEALSRTRDQRTSPTAINFTDRTNGCLKSSHFKALRSIFDTYDDTISSYVWTSHQMVDNVYHFLPIAVF
jgi:hypothetical protein